MPAGPHTQDPRTESIDRILESIGATDIPLARGGVQAACEFFRLHLAYLPEPEAAGLFSLIDFHWRIAHCTITAGSLVVSAGRQTELHEAIPDQPGERPGVVGSLRCRENTAALEFRLAGSDPRRPNHSGPMRLLVSSRLLPLRFEPASR